ncbi:CIC11C00000003396 [Sungouiella intermedia]|uniref:CIC11C00000003396 n=1 Tax=Sungouiella intermedia TaxID=45354 RepID=A0A1L0DH58_9ASCO|nr:CIC11C00000003396 [[Candida] intermedia]
MPQLIEQWRVKSAEGIAIGFISIWFLGDLFNLIGALWAGLLPEVIFLAVWKSTRAHSSSSHGAEHAPLLRRRSSALTDIAVEPQDYSVFTRFVLPIVFVVGAGCMGYFFSDSSGSEHDSPSSKIELGPQIIGYMSAILYLGARIPQIIQNHQRRSVEGLSLLFFMFSTLGNLTYAGQILFYRNDSQYVLLNLSWLLGSLGTIFEDSIIFLQFYMYKDHHAVDDSA